ncbi:MAG: toprim domain-containing protein, partial [Myxococcota bacterium]
RSLARECGIEIPESHAGETGRTERLFAVLEAAQDFYRRAFESPQAAAARAYLAERGIDSESASSWGLGFAPDRWDGLLRHLKAEGHSPETGTTAGLLAQREGGGHYDRLRGRLLFPIRDARGRVVAFGGRALGAAQEPKYLNTTESPIYRKREAFYGLPQALPAMRRAERAIVCEGYFDQLALVRAGMGEALATCGTALTREQGRQLGRRSRRVVLLFDGDLAGQSACERALEVLLPEGLRVRAAALPAGEDPDSVLAAHGPEVLRELVDGAGDALELVTQWALARGCVTPAEKSDAVGRIAPLIALVRDPVERAEYGRRLAVAAGASLHAVEAVLRATARGDSAPRLQTEATPVQVARASPEERHLRQLVRLLVQQPDLARRHPRAHFDALLPGGSWKSLVMHLIDSLPPTPPPLGHQGREGEALDVHLDVHELGAGLDQEAQARLREIAVDDEPQHGESPAEQVFEDHLRWFAKQRRSAASRNLTQRFSEPSADTNALLAEKQRQLEEKRRAALGPASGSTP